MPTENEKKERVIHTRISGSLDDELKDRASRLGVSVSNLVRNVLQNTFGLVDGIVADSAQVARSARGEASPSLGDQVVSPAPQAFATQIIGWQPLILNLNAVCGTCNEILPKGTDAAVAITDGPAQRPILCARCLQELRSDGTTDERDNR